MASPHERLDDIESALLDAVRDDCGDDVMALTRRRDRLVRELAPTLDRAGLEALVAADAAFRARVAALRARIGGEIDALRTGRAAARAYAETAAA